MRYRKLGKTGLEVSEIGYGAWGIGGKQWLGGNDDESLKALKRALELGLTFIDTALAYAEGHSEQLVGKILKQTGAKCAVATKIPPKNRVWPAQPGADILDVFPRKYVVECTETSLRNLGVDSIDLQQLHVWNPDWVEQDEWKRGLEDIKNSGKVRHIGISVNAHQPDSALAIIKTGLIETVQVIYNIFDPTAATNLLPLCQEHNVGVLARVPLDEGALTATITEQTEFEPEEFRAMYFRGDRKKEVAQRVTALRNALGATDETLATTALRFCLSHAAVSSVIPGMRSIRSVEANMPVSGRGPLTPETLEILARHAWHKNFYS